jgi:hypothetical protein
MHLITFEWPQPILFLWTNHKSFSCYCAQFILDSFQWIRYRIEYLSFTVVIPKYIYNNKKSNNNNNVSLIRSDCNFNKIGVLEARRRLYFRDFKRKNSSHILIIRWDFFDPDPAARPHWYGTVLALRAKKNKASDLCVQRCIWKANILSLFKKIEEIPLFYYYNKYIFYNKFMTRSDKAPPASGPPIYISIYKWARRWGCSRFMLGIYILW